VLVTGSIDTTNRKLVNFFEPAPLQFLSAKERKPASFDNSSDAFLGILALHTETQKRPWQKGIE
jgi:hypothetical protein